MGEGRRTRGHGRAVLGQRVPARSGAVAVPLCTGFTVLALLLAALPLSAVASSGGLGALYPPHSDVGVDTNGDGKYNYLRVDVSISVTSPGTFVVRVVLNDDIDLAKLTEGSVRVPLSAGIQRVGVLLDGTDIYNGYVDGPYFAHLSLLDDLGVTVSNGVYKTGSYRYADFQPFKATFVSPTSERTLDNDSDGLANWITLTFTVQVATDDSYTLSSQLTDSTYTVSESWTQVRLLAPGRYSLVQLFLGYPLRLAQRNGPYLVTNSLHDSRGVLVDFVFVKTTAYSYATFETPPGLLTSSISDAGVDSDGDGLWNTLRVDVGMSFESGGEYTLSGRLFTGSGALIQDAVARLTVSAGSRTASLWFDGFRIFESGADGPYRVTLQLYDADLRKLDERTYWTVAYVQTAFQPKLLYFSPPHQDTGVDFNGNGKFDVLRLSIGVLVNIPGKVRIVAGLEAGGFEGNVTQVSVLADLPAGQRTVTLDVNASDLLAAGLGGPYYVSLSAFDASGHIVDEDRFRTMNYDLADLDPGYRGQILGIQDEVGEDTDGDGLFNRLRFEVRVNVSPEGRYRLAGNLSTGAAAIAESATVVSLGAGAATVPLTFSGLEIRAAGFDGPFNLTLRLAQANDSQMLSSTVFLSSASSAASFDVAASARIYGQIRSSDSGEPLGFAEVWALDYANQLSRIGTADAFGDYDLPVFEGTYWLFVDHPSAQAQASKMRIAGTTSLDWVLLPPLRLAAEDEVVWTGWDTALVTARYVYAEDEAVARFRMDWWNGDRDAWVQPSEVPALSTPRTPFRQALDLGSSGIYLRVNGVDSAALGGLEFHDEVSGEVGTTASPAFRFSRTFAARATIGSPPTISISLSLYYDNATVDHGTWLRVPSSYRFSSANGSDGIRVFARSNPFLIDPLPRTFTSGVTTLGTCTLILSPSPFYSPGTPAAPTDLSVSVSGPIVDLSWRAPAWNVEGTSLTDLAGYYVYRSASATGAYVRINADLDPFESYIDQPGTGTYFYLVRAVNTEGVEGPAAIPAQAVVGAASASTDPDAQPEAPPETSPGPAAVFGVVAVLVFVGLAVAGSFRVRGVSKGETRRKR